MAATSSTVDASTSNATDASTSNATDASTSNADDNMEMNNEHDDNDDLQVDLEEELEKLRNIDEFKYFIDYVNSRTRKTQHNTTMRFLTLNNTIYKLLEIILERIHDIDARNSAAADVIFDTVAFALSAKVPINMEDGRGIENRREDTVIYASELCRAAKNFSSAYKNFTENSWDHFVIDEMIFEVQEIIDTCNTLAQVENLHQLLSINIEKRGEDKLLQERKWHIERLPFMQLEMESNSVQPLLYHLPHHADKQLTTLIRNAGISTLNIYLELSDVVNKVYDYATTLMTKENMTPEAVKMLLTATLGYHTQHLNMKDKRSLIWPLSRCLAQEPYATMWNKKFPTKNFLQYDKKLWATPISLQTTKANNIVKIDIPKRWDVTSDN